MANAPPPSLPFLQELVSKNAAKNRSSGILAALPGFRKEVAAAGFGEAPDLTALTSEAAALRAYLGATDYSKQLQQSQDAAKLQAALSIAARGFASMGATPKRGESPLATLGRELAAPIAADLIPVSAKLMERKAAIDAAKQAEDRQVKLAAYTQATARKKEQDTVALEILKLGKTTDKLLSDIFVLYNTNNKGLPTTPVLDAEGSITQGRQKGKTSFFTNLRDQSSFSPGKNEMMIKTSDHVKGLDGSKSKVANVGYLQNKTSHEIIPLARQGVGQPGFNSLTGDIITDPENWTFLGNSIPKADSPTIANNFVLVDEAGIGQQDASGRLIQLRQKGGQWIKLGGTGGGSVFSIPKDAEAMPVSNYFAKDAAAKDLKGVDSPGAKANFEGFLNRFAAIQEAGDLAKTSLKFDPFRHKKGEQPFTYLDGTPLSDKDGKRIHRMIETDYFNLTKEGFKAGQEPTSINHLAVNNFLKRSLNSYGLKLPPLAPGEQRPPSQLTSKVSQDERYATASEGFKTNPIADQTLEKMPNPNVANYGRGTGRLKLFQGVGVDFGEATTSPPSLDRTLSEPQLAEAVNERAKAVSLKSEDREGIQTRIHAERLAIGTDLAATLNAQANTPVKVAQVMGEALKKKRDALSTIQQTPKNRDIAADLGTFLHSYDKVSRMGVLMARSRVPGFFTGPFQVLGKQLFGVDLKAWVTSEEGQQAANEFIATLPLVHQIVSREILVASGEGSRISDRDLQGIQRVLPRSGYAFDYETSKLKALKRHLAGGIQSLLENVGDFAPSDALLTKAASLGFDLKSIKGKNNYYNPFLKNEKYAVTRQPIPSFSQEYQDQIRDTGIFGYVAKGGNGLPLMYDLMVIDPDGKPVWDPNKSKWETVIVSQEGLTNPDNISMVKFNRDWLKREHGLAR